MCKVLRTFLEWSAHCCVRMVCHNKYHRVGSLNSQSSFLSILDIRKTKIKVPAMSSSWGGCRWQPSCCALTRHKETRALWCLLLQGHELTPLISFHPLTSWLPYSSSCNAGGMVSVWTRGQHSSVPVVTLCYPRGLTGHCQSSTIAHLSPHTQTAKHAKSLLYSHFHDHPLSLFQLGNMLLFTELKS